MIFDGPDKFPNSAVDYTRFKHYPLRERFAKLREQEFWLQDTLKKGAIREDNWTAVWTRIERSELFVLIRSKLFLEFTEAELLWMAHNISDEFLESQMQLEMRKQNAKLRKRKALLESKQLSLFEEKEIEEELEDFIEEDLEDGATD